MSILPSKRVILCVDDEPILLRVRELVLRPAGYEVVAATNAEEALAAFRSRHIDLVITDHLLPGQTGLHMARQMKRVRADVPIMLLSGLPDAPEGIECVDDYVIKGMPVPIFLEHVTELLR